MAAKRITAAIALCLAASAGKLVALGVPGATSSSGGGSAALVDSSGNVAARPLNESIMLVTLPDGVVAPAQIRPIYGTDGRTASGLATWNSGGSVLFTSADCTTGAHVHGPMHAGIRASAQVQTAAGIVLFVGAIGPGGGEAIRSILYETGCARVAIQQDGLIPVVTTINLTTTHPPPLSFQ